VCWAACAQLLCCSPVQLEAVGSVSVCGVALQVLGQVDDHDGIEGAFLQHGRGPDTTKHATSPQLLGENRPAWTVLKSNGTHSCNLSLPHGPISGMWAHEQLLCPCSPPCWQHALQQPLAGGCRCHWHTLTQIPQPMHSSSEIHASLLLLTTSMHSLPAGTHNTTQGQLAH
jgi:hypothetical protein